MPRLFFVHAVAAMTLAAAPAITRNGVVHAASLAPPGLPNAALAQGALFSIFGSGLGPEVFATANAFPLQTTLGGVRITATQGSTTVNAIPVFVFSSQINAILPSNTPLGRVAIRVIYNGETSRPEVVEVVKTNFATFAVNSAGFGPGVIQNFLAADNQPLNSLTHSAKPGGAIVLWGSGLGPVPNDSIAPSPGDLPGQLEVLVGGKPATKLYAGRAPCCSGLDQLVYTLPNDVPAGCYVPVQIVTGGTSSGNVTTMAISADGSPCRDAVNPFHYGGRTPGNLGTILLAHAAYYERRGAGPREYTADMGTATFHFYGGGEFAFDPHFSLPPAGTCTVYTAGATSLQDSALARKLSAPFSTLDAGTSVTAATQGRTVSMPRGAIYPRDYQAVLGASNGTVGAPFLTGPGTYTVSGTGGSQVGAFNVTLTSFPQMNWTNRAESLVVDRTKPLRLTWEVTNPGPAGVNGHVVLIIGGGSLIAQKATAMFLCTARASDGSFSVPASILRTLPANGPVGTSNSVLGIGVLPLESAAPVTATGLQSGGAVLTSASIATVTYQ